MKMGSDWSRGRHLRLVFLVTALLGLPQQSVLRGQPRAAGCDLETRSGLPDWFRTWFEAQGLQARFEIACYLNPFYLRGNFDARGQLDLAVPVVERSSGKRGVLVVHRPGLAFFVWGAGTRRSETVGMTSAGSMCGTSTRHRARRRADLRQGSLARSSTSSSRSRRAVRWAGMDANTSGFRDPTSELPHTRMNPAAFSFCDCWRVKLLGRAETQGDSITAGALSRRALIKATASK